MFKPVFELWLNLINTQIRLQFKKLKDQETLKLSLQKWFLPYKWRYKFWGWTLVYFGNSLWGQGWGSILLNSRVDWIYIITKYQIEIDMFNQSRLPYLFMVWSYLNGIGSVYSSCFMYLCNIDIILYHSIKKKKNNHKQTEPLMIGVVFSDKFAGGHDLFDWFGIFFDRSVY